MIEKIIIRYNGGTGWLFPPTRMNSTYFQAKTLYSVFSGIFNLAGNSSNNTLPVGQTLYEPYSRWFTRQNERLLQRYPMIADVGTQMNCTIPMAGFLMIMGMAPSYFVGKSLSIEPHFKRSNVERMNGCFFNNPSTFNNGTPGIKPDGAGLVIATDTAIQLEQDAVVGGRRFIDPSARVRKDLDELEETNEGKNSRLTHRITCKTLTGIVQGTEISENIIISQGSTCIALAFCLMNNSPTLANDNNSIKVAFRRDRGRSVLPPPIGSTVDASCVIGSKTVTLEGVKVEGSGNNAARNCFQNLVSVRGIANGELSYDQWRDYNCVMCFALNNIKTDTSTSTSGDFDNGQYSFTVKYSDGAAFDDDTVLKLIVVEEVFAVKDGPDSAITYSSVRGAIRKGEINYASQSFISQQRLSVARKAGLVE